MIAQTVNVGIEPTLVLSALRANVSKAPNEIEAIRLIRARRKCLFIVLG